MLIELMLAYFCGIDQRYRQLQIIRNMGSDKVTKMIRKRHKLSKIWAVTNDKNYQEVSTQVTSIQIICRGQSVVHGVPATKRIIRSSSR